MRGIPLLGSGVWAKLKGERSHESINSEMQTRCLRIPYQDSILLRDRSSALPFENNLFEQPKTGVYGVDAERT